MMQSLISGGTTHYGQVAGILMLDSMIPRIPGDPGHAATFEFPVQYGIVRDFQFEDLVEIRRENLNRILAAAIELQRQKVNFVAADCGLFSVFQADIADVLDIPFIGSSLNLIPLLAGFLNSSKKIGLITGHTGLLRQAHLHAAGAEPDRLVIRGMEHSNEFQRVVIKRGLNLNPEAMRTGVISAVKDLFRSNEPIGAIVLECTNLISFRRDIQAHFRLPVFDMVSLIEFFAEGYRLRDFKSDYIQQSP
jgi:hypothetical protein